MKSKFMFIVLISFAFLSCEEIIDHHGNNDNKNHPLVKIMDKMSDNMDKMEMTHDPDHDFAMMMVEHHKGAIEMAEYELEHGDNQELKEMAQEMKDKQQMEIEKLEAFMDDHTVMPNEQHGMAFMEASEMAMDKMEFRVNMQYLNNKTDHDFAALMIHHHRSAVEMAEAEIQFGHSEEMKEMAKMMKEDQLKEIDDLKEWLDKH